MTTAELTTGFRKPAPGKNDIELPGGEATGATGVAIIPIAVLAYFGNGDSLYFCIVYTKSECLILFVASMSVNVDNFWLMYDSFWKLGLLFFMKFFLLISLSNCISS